MLISFFSLAGSPGVSTAVLALTWSWPRDAVAVEADPTGGHALAVFDPDGALGRRGLLELTVAARKTPLHHAMSAQLVTLPDGTGRHHLLPGCRGPLESDGVPWTSLAGLFREFKTVDVLVDCGRIRAHGAPRAVMAASDLVVLVLRNDRHSLARAVRSFELVQREAGLTASGDGSLVAVVVPAVSQGFPPAEVAKVFAAHGVPLAGVLAKDPAAAAQFADQFQPSRRFAASPLLSSTRAVAQELERRASTREALLRSTNVVRFPPRPGPPSVRMAPVPAVRPIPVPRPNHGGEPDDAG
ncbi:hypothetical protein [Amycolatopsis silviterrae]|uniref:MinD-like ATPase involved in chromosome partitioning or flagellar assembly n=1 Tax=Amycolatopsis silviterrae TaxID=1656914 RepID=A0ABW5HG33_9PSEU